MQLTKFFTIVASIGLTVVCALPQSGLPHPANPVFGINPNPTSHPGKDNKPTAHPGPTSHPGPRNKGAGATSTVSYSSPTPLPTPVNILTDGDFEGYQACSDFCFTSSYENWIGSGSGTSDATIFHYSPYAHTGNGVGLLGSATGADDLPGTLTYAHPLGTTAGLTYVVKFWINSAFSGASLETGAFVQGLWNGVQVFEVVTNYLPWTEYSFEVVAVGNDILAFRGGKAPAWSFIDDITVIKQ